MYQTGTERYRILTGVLAAAARLPKALRGTRYQRFLEAYYANVDAEDMAAREPAALARAALAHRRFAHRRRGRALVRAFNPTVGEHGYSSPNTVIELVNDDMPFLVDTIGVVLTRRSFTMHFLAHPVFAVLRDASGVVLECKGRDAPARAEQWARRHAASVDVLKRIVVDLRIGPPPDFATLSVGLQAVRRLAQE